MSTFSDLRDECDSLYDVVAGLDEAAWGRPTLFHGWTTHDQIDHNHHLDLLAVMSLRDPSGFAGIVSEVARSSSDPGYSFRAYTLATLGRLPRNQALARWRQTYTEMCGLLEERDPSERVAWFGPPMSVDGCAIARQMEVWAHGQDIYDLFSWRRLNAARLRNIALLGVKTFGWSFVNRGLTPPAKPYVELTAPSGARWCFNDAASPERVAGTAEDFCLVVTQRRHVLDTGLETVGNGAKTWMHIAQCFAGDPATGPEPGVRQVAYADGSLF